MILILSIKYIGLKIMSIRIRSLTHHIRIITQSDLNNQKTHLEIINKKIDKKLNKI